jgi:lipopolysaccharide/colanic/teichoic acid biosynthesis glycosyltransferase
MIYCGLKAGVVVTTVSGDKTFTNENISSIHEVSSSEIVWARGRPAVPDSTRSRRMKFFAKRLVDIAGSAIGLLILAPLLIVIGAVIRLTDGGPAFFCQTRLGRDEVPFQMLKFRTMYPAHCDEGDLEQAIENDPRITPFGSFLRRNSLDELPQLFNVLLGQMSLVGPRPHVPNMLAAGMRYDALVPGYAFRHHIRPGMTGWAQCNGLRGPTEERNAAIDRILHDFVYVQNVSVRLDVRIMLLTIAAEGRRLRGELAACSHQVAKSEVANGKQAAKDDPRQHC